MACWSFGGPRVRAIARPFVLFLVECRDYQLSLFIFPRPAVVSRAQQLPHGCQKRRARSRRRCCHRGPSPAGEGVGPVRVRTREICVTGDRSGSFLPFPGAPSPRAGALAEMSSLFPIQHVMFAGEEAHRPLRDVAGVSRRVPNGDQLCLQNKRRSAPMPPAFLPNVSMAWRCRRCGRPPFVPAQAAAAAAAAGCPGG